MVPRIRKLSTRQAAELAGLSVAAFRTAMHRHRADGGVDLRLSTDQWPDLRTPMYDEKSVRKWIADRPGSGQPGRPRPHRKTDTS